MYKSFILATLLAAFQAINLRYDAQIENNLSLDEEVASAEELGNPEEEEFFDEQE